MDVRLQDVRLATKIDPLKLLSLKLSTRVSFLLLYN